MRETTEHYDRVRRFMELAQQETPGQPQASLSLETRQLRARLILEEAFETIEDGLGLNVTIDLGSNVRAFEGTVIDLSMFSAGGFAFVDVRPYDLVELVDGCCDLSVVNTGTLIAAGITDAEPLRLVDENNLAKFGPGGYRREDGKWMKPPDHTPPNLAGEIERQRQAAIEGSGNTSPRNGFLSMIGALERAALQRDHEAQELTAALDYSAQIPEEDARLLRKAARILQAPADDPGNPPPPSRRRPMPPPSICLPTNWTEDPVWCQLVRTHLPDIWDQEQARRAACYHAGEPPPSDHGGEEGREVPPHRSGGGGFLRPDKTGPELREAGRVMYQRLMGFGGREANDMNKSPTKEEAYSAIGSLMDCTRPVEGHTDPKSLTDCWNTVTKYIDDVSAEVAAERQNRQRAEEQAADDTHLEWCSAVRSVCESFDLPLPDETPAEETFGTAHYILMQVVEPLCERAEKAEPPPGPVPDKSD